MEKRLNEVAEMYANQFKSSLAGTFKVVSDEDIAKEAHNRSYKMGDQAKLMYTQGFEDCGEWYREQLTK